MSNLKDFKNSFRVLKKRAKEIIFINVALCDEISKVEDKITRAREERIYLIQRLLRRRSQFGVIKKVTSEVTGQQVGSLKKGGKNKKKKKSKKVVLNNDNEDSNAESNEGPSSSEISQKVSKKHKQLLGGTIVCPPKKATLTPLDNSGRPIFPVELGTLIVYSIGEELSAVTLKLDQATLWAKIVTAPNYHSPECIYPVGYCSTRLYLSIDPQLTTCLYTCKVTDAGDRPKFEILPEDSVEHAFIGLTPDQSHLKLLNYINTVRGPGTVPVAPNGAGFFGLMHPTLQNLIQCFPSARKCKDYKWVKFEVTKDLSQLPAEQDPTVNIHLLL